MEDCGLGRSTEVCGTRTRKRILDPQDAHEDDNHARRVGLFTDWQEAIKTIGVPNKKGFLSVEGGSHQRHWESSEDIDQGLSADFDDSLSGLGVDISTASYDMSEALLALPSVPQFKEEAASPTIDKQSVATSSPATFDDTSQSNTTDRLFKLLCTDNVAEGPPPSIQQLLQQNIAGGSSQGSLPLTIASQAHHAGLGTMHSPSSEAGHETCTVTHQPQPHQDNRFQYILGAATSVATKVNEESLSYLNQGQSYEIRVKKLGDLTRCRGMLYHCVVRVCFHERRLQYMEKQQLETWQQMRPGERILEIDIPLSYGVHEVKQDPRSLNKCEFDWDPTKEVGVYIKVNCISTEFTPKKHGGEKGVPFRLQVETYAHNSSSLDHLYVCACQIKVFKLKGADRKHKQDREKIMKRTPSEQEKYQPSCECTILTQLSPEAVYVPGVYEPQPPGTPPVQGVKSLSLRGFSPTADQKSEGAAECGSLAENGVGSGDEDPVAASSYCGAPLHTDSSPAQTAAWLVANRFNKYSSVFANFSGTDILRLSRSDLVDICGAAEGLRLFYALHAKRVVPRLILYVCLLEREQLYHAVYLETLTCAELTRRLSALIQITTDSIQDVYLQGPAGINVLVTDEVVRNMTPEAVLTMEVVQDSSHDRFRLIVRLNPTGSPQS